MLLADKAGDEERRSAHQAEPIGRFDLDTQETKTVTMSSDTNFFCTSTDILASAAAWEALIPLHYYPISAEEPCIPADSLSTCLQDPTFGREGHRLLISNRSTRVHAETIESSAREWFAYNLRKNPTAITLYLGLHQADILTPGSLATLGKSEEAVSLYKTLAKQLKKQCRRVHSYWVGPEALSLLRSGFRLAHNRTASSVYDLRE